VPTNPSTNIFRMNKDLLISFVRKGYGYVLLGAAYLAPVFLLIMRLHWGWQFFETGKGKLSNIDKIVSFFHDLGIPFPTLNAYLAGTTECLGGLCLLLGIASRLTVIPLIFTLIVAYLTADRDALYSFFSDPDKFTGADPFLFMLTAVIVLLFGPGWISVDGLLAKIFGENKKEKGASPARNLA
jgi:putative oxidoreductase